MDSRHLLIGLSTAGVLLAGTAVVGRVYQRAGGLASPDAVAAAVDGRFAYRSEVRINGGAGDLSVVSVPENLHLAAHQLRRAESGGELFLFEGARMNSGLIVRPDEIIRLLMFELESPRQCLLLMVRQTVDDFRASRQPPPVAQLTDAPIYPGSRPVRFWRDQGARLAVEVSRTADGGEAILGFFRESLRGSGWVDAMPAGSGAVVFLKGRQICSISVKADAESSNLITVLHKTLGD